MLAILGFWRSPSSPPLGSCCPEHTSHLYQLGNFQRTNSIGGKGEWVGGSSLWLPQWELLCGQHARPEHLESPWEPTCWHRHCPTSTDGKTEPSRLCRPQRPSRMEKGQGDCPQLTDTRGSVLGIPPPSTTAEGLPWLTKCKERQACFQLFIQFYYKENSREALGTKTDICRVRKQLQTLRTPNPNQTPKAHTL